MAQSLPAALESATAALVHDGTHILSATRAAVCMLGYTGPRALAGLELPDLVSPAHRDHLERHVQDILSGNAPSITLATELVRDDGSRFQAEMNSSSESRNRTTVIVTTLSELSPDVTTSRFQHEHYRSLVESTSAILWEANPETFEFTFVSPEAEKLLGYPAQRWTGEAGFWHDHIHPEDREWAVRYCARATRAGRRHTFDYRMLAADGRVVWVRDVVNVIKQDDRPVNLVGVMIDITESKNNEMALSRLAGLQRKMVEVSQTFIAGSDDLGPRINHALGLIGAHVGVDRSYLFRVREHFTRLDNIHEWCADGVAPQIEDLQNVPGDAAPGILEALKRHEVVHLPDIDDLGPEWRVDQAHLRSQDIRSLVCAPIIINGELYGFIGFDAVRKTRAWTDDEIDMLRIFGEMLGSTIHREQTETALLESEKMRSKAEILAKLGSWELDIRQGVLKPSPEWCRITGLPQRAITREEIIATVHPDDLGRIEHALQQSLDTGKPYRIEHRIYHCTTGELRWIRINSNVIHEDGEPVRLYGYAQDITERRAAEESLAKSEARYRSVVDNIREVVFQTDTRGYVTFLNPAWEEITGHTVDDTVGRHFLDTVHPGDKAHIRAEIEPMVRGRVDGCAYESRYLTRNGDTCWLEINVRLTRDEQGRPNGTAGTLRDVTRQREAEQRMEHLARHDPLTELPNRILANDRLEQMLKSARHDGHCSAVVFVDIDHFKRVNDTLGHAIGDRLLKEASRRLQDAVDEQDTVARLSGDEFAVLLANLEQPEAVMPIVGHILQAFREPFMLDGRELVLTASIGAAIYPKDGTSAQDLMRNADTALYESKLAGRNTHHFFTAAMNQQVSRRLVLEEALRHALSRDELQVVYQPVIRLADDQVVGAEALLRWQHPTLGAVPPVEFIPVAEQTGLIHEIGIHVLHQAVRQAVIWRKHFRKSFHVSVNVSPQQFRDAELAERVEKILAGNGLPGNALEIEITEGVLLSGHIRVGQTLERLRELGVGIAMDDFGTGYASLSYLREYSFDTLKVDRSFVQGSTTDIQDRELVLTSLRLAQGLKMRAVAEGVETAEQADLLRDNGCQYAQGYLFSRPLVIADFETLINRA